MNKIRAEFPFLSRKYRGQSLAYLDNASTTQKPQVVLDALIDTYKNHYANIHRGVYDLSVEATQLYEGVREKVAKLIGAKSSSEVIFTKNTTEAINLLAYVLSESLTGGDSPRFAGEAGEILLTQMEHHSNIVPWQLLRERLGSRGPSIGLRTGKGIVIKYIPITGDGGLDLPALDKLVTKKTKVLSLTLMSNVLGTINDVNRVSSIVNRLSPKAIVIVDAAQAVGHMKIDVNTLGCDFLAFSAHKMYGPAGVGVLWGKKELLDRLPPFMGGGDMILSVDWHKTTFNEVPYKFEAGTPSIADVIAFGKAIDFIEQVGYEKISKHEMELTRYAFERLSKDPLIEIYGPKVILGRKTKNLKTSGRNEILHGVYPETLRFAQSHNRRVQNDRGSVISFNVDGIHPHDVASILSGEGVAIRSGHHCAQPLMKVLGINAACRVSFGIYNTKEEVERLIEGILKVKKTFRINTKHEIRNSKQITNHKNLKFQRVSNL